MTFFMRSFCTNLLGRKARIDAKLDKLRGNFSKRTPKEMKSVFNISYNDPSTIKVLKEKSIDRLEAK